MLLPTFKHRNLVVKILWEWQQSIPILRNATASQAKQTLCLLFYYTVCNYYMSVATLIASKTPSFHMELPDVAFWLLPHLPEWEPYQPFLLIVTTTITLMFLVSCERGLLFLNRFVGIHSLCILVRCWTLMATHYPDMSHTCDTYKPPETWPEILSRALFFNGG